MEQTLFVHRECKRWQIYFICTHWEAHISSNQTNAPSAQVKMELAIDEIYLKNTESHINWNRRPLVTLDKFFQGVFLPLAQSKEKIGEVRMIH